MMYPKPRLKLYRVWRGADADHMALRLRAWNCVPHNWGLRGRATFADHRMAVVYVPGQFLLSADRIRHG